VFVSRPVDLVLLDYNMPEMNGDVAACQMKACRPDVPVALLSSDDWVPPSKLKTVDAFVSKSEPIARFLEIVDHLLSLRLLFRPMADSGSLPPSKRCMKRCIARKPEGFMTRPIPRPPQVSLARSGQSREFVAELRIPLIAVPIEGRLSRLCSKAEHC